MKLTPVEQAQFETFCERLVEGEASCLSVARERGYRLATDDKDARRLSRQLGISLTGTLGILAMLVKQRQITLGEGDHFLHEMIAAGYLSDVPEVIPEMCAKAVVRRTIELAAEKEHLLVHTIASKMYSGTGRVLQHFLDSSRSEVDLGTALDEDVLHLFMGDAQQLCRLAETDVASCVMQRLGAV